MNTAVVIFSTSCNMLKEEYSKIKSEEDLNRMRESNAEFEINEEEHRILLGFVYHINYTTSVPSAIDKQVVAKAYYASKCYRCAIVYMLIMS